MNALSRRDLLRASAGAAMVAVPMAALAGPAAKAATNDADEAEIAAFDAAGPVMFCVQDAARGQVTILHGTSEVVVTDRALVNQIMKAAGVRQNG